MLYERGIKWKFNPLLVMSSSQYHLYTMSEKKCLITAVFHFRPSIVSSEKHDEEWQSPILDLVHRRSKIIIDDDHRHKTIFNWPVH